MGTDLMELYHLDKQKCKDALRSTSTGILLAELDDTIQIDICGVSNEMWAVGMVDQKVVYNLIVGELRRRLQEGLK